MVDWRPVARARKSRTARLEAAGQIPLDLQAETPWVRRISEARQLALDLAPGTTLESDYGAWAPALGPGRFVVHFRKRSGVVVPASFIGTSPGSILAGLRRGTGGRHLLASRWWPWGYFSVWLRRPA